MKTWGEENNKFPLKKLITNVRMFMSLIPVNPDTGLT